MARVMTARELSTAQIVAIREEVKRKLVAYAAKETGKRTEEFAVRDAMAKTDFGLGTEKWDNESTLITVAWTKDWSKELPKSKFVAFYGIVEHTDDMQVIGVRYKVGTAGKTTREVVMFGRMKAEDVLKAFHEPVIYKGGEVIYVEYYNQSGANIAAGGELIELLALVAEPWGETISGKLPY